MVPLGTDLFGNIQRLDNTLDGLQGRLENTQAYLENTRQQLEEAKVAVTKPFPHEDDLASKSSRLAELNAMLDMDKPEPGCKSVRRGKEITKDTIRYLFDLPRQRKRHLRGKCLLRWWLIPDVILCYTTVSNQKEQPFI